jgi:SRSO17 transposase
MGMVLKPAALAGWHDELAVVQQRLGALFGRPEPRRQAGLYLEGLLGSVERKNGWQLAEHIGDARPWRTQRVLSHVQWDQDKARDVCRDYVIEHLGTPDGMLIVDETACPRGFHGHVSRKEPSRPASGANIPGPQDGLRTVKLAFFSPTAVLWAIP